MPKSVQKTTKQTSSNKQRTLIYTAVIILFVLAYDVGIGRNIAYYAKWVSCGQKPVTVNATYKGPRYYEEGSATPVLLRPTSFCTPLEAEQAGYSANPNTYEFPNLNNN